MQDVVLKESLTFFPFRLPVKKRYSLFGWKKISFHLAAPSGNFSLSSGWVCSQEWEGPAIVGEFLSGLFTRM